MDVSAKPDVARFAEAVAEAAPVRRGLCGVGARAAVLAHRFIPLLHPIPLTAESICGDRIVVRASTHWSTGVEMDALFGAAVAAIVAAGGSGPIRVVAKVKGEERGVASLPDSPAVLERERGPGYAVAEAVLRLRSVDSLWRAEKGDPIWLAKAASALASKRLCELVDTECALVSHVRTEIQVDSVVRIETLVKARNVLPREDALLAAAAAAITIWDVVKKFEKDEAGQYPYTEISALQLVEWGSQ